MSITDTMRKAFNECTVMAGVEPDFECVYITKDAAVLMLDDIDAAFVEGHERAVEYGRTLGAGTCQVDVLNTGDCAGYECSEYIMHCNGCGHEFGHVLYNEDGDVWMSEKPNFCPNCGRKVVGE